MTPVLRKTIAVLMIIFTSIGILLSVFFIYTTWRVRQPVTVKLQSVFMQTSSILQTTVVGLDIADQMVTNVYSTTIYLGDATNSLAQTIDSTGNVIDSAGSFIGEDLVNTITNTQKTLETAQTSAQVVDNILGTIAKIPLLGLDYDPSQPLSSAIGDVSNSLDPLQNKLQGFQDSLSTTQSSIKEFSDQMLLLNQNINQINQKLAASKSTINEYHDKAISLNSWIKDAIPSLPDWVIYFCAFLTVFIILIIMVQATMLLQGIYLFSNSDGSNIPSSVTTQELIIPSQTSDNNPDSQGTDSTSPVLDEQENNNPGT